MVSGGTPPPLFGPIRSPNTWHSLPDVLSLTSGESVMFGHTISPMNDGNPHRQTIVFIFQQKCTCEGRGPLPQCACGAPLVHKSERGGPQAGICLMVVDGVSYSSAQYETAGSPSGCCRLFVSANVAN